MMVVGASQGTQMYRIYNAPHGFFFPKCFCGPLINHYFTITFLGHELVKVNSLQT